MSRTATQLAGNASSIFQAWLDLKRQTNPGTRSHGARGQSIPKGAQRRSDTSR